MARRDYLSHKKLETVGRLAGGIAHDFNNYLGSILADADLALADLPPGSACGEEVDRIRTVAIRASETVRELLVYMGQEHSQIGLVDLSQLVQEMLALLKSSIKGHARLTTNLAKDSLLVFAEAPELRQLVMNLVLNASDALGQGGAEIQVTTSRTTITQKDSESVLGPGEYARLDVLDNGGGMSHDVQARIFDAYFTTKKSGRGLGLSIVQRIVHRYGGAVRCYSASGEGTRFTVMLPLASASEREPSVPESTPELAPS
jgi:signal transduction histidine kinase